MSHWLSESVVSDSVGDETGRNTRHSVVMRSPYGATSDPMLFWILYALTPLSHSWFVIQHFICNNTSPTPLAQLLVNILNVSV